MGIGEANGVNDCVCGGTDARACRDGVFPVYAASLLGQVSCVEALIRLKADVLQCGP